MPVGVLGYLKLDKKSLRLFLKGMTYNLCGLIAIFYVVIT